MLQSVEARPQAGATPVSASMASLHTAAISRMACASTSPMQGLSPTVSSRTRTSGRMKPSSVPSGGFGLPDTTHR